MADSAPWQDTARPRRVVVKGSLPELDGPALEKKHNCAGLAAHLADTAPLRAEGWDFQRIIWGHKEKGPNYDHAPLDSQKWEYLARPIGNAWNDLAIYRRAVAAAPRASKSEASRVPKSEAYAPEEKAPPPANPFAALAGDD